MTVLNFRDCEDGQGLVEYAVILVLVSIAAVATVALLGPIVAEAYQDVLDWFP